MKISVDDAIKFSRKLAEKIQKEYNPDIIIGVKEGGVLPAIEVSGVLGKSLYWIKTSRVEPVLEASLRSDYEKASSEQRKVVSQVFDDEWFKSEPKVVNAEEFNLKNKNVLVVDDAAHTGKTLTVVLEHLSKAMPSDIKTAVLFHVDEYEPDFYVGKGENKYPWSTWGEFEADSADYRAYLESENDFV